MPEPSKFDVFLSHNRLDKPAVVAVAEQLRAQGLQVWLDLWELRPGHPWQEALEAIIANTGAAAVLVGADGLGPWENQEMRACLDEFVRRQLPVIPVLLPGCPRRPGLPLFLQAFTWVDLRDNPEDGLKRLLWGITGAKPAAADGPPAAESPYRGLLPFEARHRDLFHGREKESAALLEKVRTQPFLAMLGSSGSGKSSLLGAGLIPRLPAGEWRVLSLRPRNDLFESLAAALLPHLYPDLVEQAAQRKPLSEKLAEPDFDLAHLLQGLVTDSPKRRVLLAIDQFEEVFTLSSDRPRQRRAVELLLSAIRGGEAVTLLLVLRADFFGRCLDIEPLKRALDRWPTFNLGAMGQDALRAAIVRPAELNSLRLEQGLADAILAELGDEPGQLALLQTALDELWQRSDRRTLTHQGYRAVGGVAQALARKADAFLNGYDEAGRERLRRIFMQLVRPGEGEEDTRQIATETQVGAENWELVAQLASARLVVTGRVEQESPSPHGGGGVGERGSTVELAHEALIRHWQALRGWIAEDRAFRLWQNKLRDSRAEWASHGFDEGYLLRGAKLLEAEERLAEKSGWLAEDEIDFIKACAALRQREADEKERQRLERERLQQRVLHTTAAALVMALGLTGVAGWQWRTAETRKAQAEENFQKAKQAVDDYLTIVSELKLRNQPAMEPVRKALLEKALYYYENLAKQRSDDEKALADVAMAQDRVGKIRQTLGDTDGAFQAHRKSLELSEQLASNHPENPSYQRDVAISHHELGLLRYYHGDTNRAKEDYRKALEILKRLRSEHSEVLDYPHQLANVYDHLGLLLQHSDDSQGAKDAYHNALEIRQQLAGAHPEEPRYQSALAGSLNDLALLLKTQGDSAGAKETYQKALDIRERLVNKHPQDLDYQHGLAASYNGLGLILQDSGDYAGAKNAFGKTLEIQKRLAFDHPDNMSYQRELAIAYHNLGRLLQHSGNIAEAEGAYRKALEIEERLAQKNPEVLQYSLDLATSYAELGFVLKDIGDSTGAKNAYRKSVEILDRLTREHPGIPEYQSRLGTAYDNFGFLLDKSGDSAGAQESYRQGLKIREDLVSKHSDISQYQSDLASSHLNLGFLLNSSGKSAEAQAAYRNALQIRERLVRNHPNQLEYQRELANVYNNLGALLQDSDDSAGTKEAYRNALEIRKGLASGHPEIPEYQSELALSYHNLGFLLNTSGDRAGAKEACGKALIIRERLAREHPQLPKYQRDLASSYNSLATINRDSGDWAGAGDMYSKALVIQDKLIKDHPDIPEYQLHKTFTIANLAKVELLNRHPQQALLLAQQALERDPGASWIKTRLAHALLFTGQYPQAAKFYLANPAEKLPVFGGKTVAAVVLEDFQQFRAKGITHPDMAKIEKLLRTGKPR